MGDKLHTHRDDVVNTTSLPLHRQFFAGLCVFDGKAQSEMLYRAVDLGLATYQKPFLSALKYCHLSEQFDKFRLDHVGGHHTLCPAKMKGHGEDRDLRSVVVI